MSFGGPWLPAGAFLLDAVLGDPHGWPHPVVWIGRLIERLETFWTGLFGRTRTAGALLAATTLAVTGAVAWGVLAAADSVHAILGTLAALWLGYSCLALRSLCEESRRVVDLLEGGDLAAARRALAMLVSRDTAQLEPEEILRAAVETLSENTSDGVVAPLFYLALGGPLPAVLYKAASTLDSMVGYRNERYREVGWASARLDDLLNWIPARLTSALMVIAAALLGLDSRGALAVLRRDARRHASPNAGFPEAAAAGALGVRLGGPAVYFGVPTEKPTLGDPGRPLTPAVFRQAVRLTVLSSLLALALGMGLSFLLGGSPSA